MKKKKGMPADKMKAKSAEAIKPGMAKGNPLAMGAEKMPKKEGHISGSAMPAFGGKKKGKSKPKK